MHVTAPAPPIPAALVVQHNIAELLVRAAEDVRAARMRFRAPEIDHTSARALGAVRGTLEQVGRIEGECARIRAVLSTLTWEIAL